MRNVYVILIGIAALVLISATAVAGEEMFQGFRVVNVIVNGQPLQSDVPAVNFFGRTVLPLRTVAEAAGMDVQWDLVSITATLTSRFTVDEFNGLQSENTRLSTELDAAKRDTDSANTKLATAQAEIKRLTATAPVLVNPTPDPIVQPALPLLKTAKEIEAYLQANYGTVDTAAGALTLTYKISGPNDYNWVPFDLASKALPGKKLHGGYYTSWYKYPTIREGYEARRYLSWQNYDGTALTNYADAELSAFWFNPYIDDVKY